VNNAIIYVIDDNQEFRESTEWMLQSTGYQVEGYGDPVLALNEIKQSHHICNQCCLLDIRMPAMNGLEFHDRLNSMNLQIPIIYMSGHGDIPLAVEVMDKGAITFLEKPLNNNLLKMAIEKALNQREESEPPSGVNRDGRSQQAYMDRLQKLTDREHEVLIEIVAGKMNKVIAIDLGISVKTVELHRSRVMSKMKAKTPADLVKMVITKNVYDEYANTE
jgi:two-component system, LuxR family, response regulator FixJ